MTTPLSKPPLNHVENSFFLLRVSILLGIGLGKRAHGRGVPSNVLHSVEGVGLVVLMAVVLVVVVALVVVVLVVMLVVVRVVLVLGLEGLDDVLDAVLGLDLGGLGRESHFWSVDKGIGLFGRVKCCECNKKARKWGARWAYLYHHHDFVRTKAPRARHDCSQIGHGVSLSDDVMLNSLSLSSSLLFAARARNMRKVQSSRLASDQSAIMQRQRRRFCSFCESVFPWVNSQETNKRQHDPIFHRDGEGKGHSKVVFVRATLASLASLGVNKIL